MSRGLGGVQREILIRTEEVKSAEVPGLWFSLLALMGLTGVARARSVAVRRATSSLVEQGLVETTRALVNVGELRRQITPRGASWHRPYVFIRLPLSEAEREADRYVVALYERHRASMHRWHSDPSARRRSERSLQPTVEQRDHDAALLWLDWWPRAVSGFGVVMQKRPPRDELTAMHLQAGGMYEATPSSLRPDEYDTQSALISLTNSIGRSRKLQRLIADNLYYVRIF